MSNDSVQDLRKHLFETIQALKDKDNPMDIQRAKAVSNAAQVIVNSAKVEIEYMKVTGGKGTGFVPELEDKTNQGGSSGAGVVTHRHRSSWQ